MITLQAAMTTISRPVSLLHLRSIVTRECPGALKALKFIDHEYTMVRIPKGYNLVKRPNKRMGYIYYVRYWHNGKMIPSKWSTKTNDHEKASKFAREKREILISKYLGRNGNEVYRFFEKFFELDNPVYKSECVRNGELSEEKRKRYRNVIIKEFIPFLKDKKKRAFSEIDVTLLNDFQDHLLAKGVKAVTVNIELIAVGKVLKYITRKGLIIVNPYLNLAPVPTKAEEKRTHGCYEISKMKGIFEKEWQDNTSKLLNLIIYTMDMRNSEITRICKNDIKELDGCHFLELKASKTINGLRLIPLHNRVYRDINEYAKDMKDDECIFKGFTSLKFMKASQTLGKTLGVSEEYLKNNFITFYSGRHFWKTLMNAGGLGEEAEELFMGHKVSSNVSKLYNHRDKRGKDLTVKKAKEVFAILDQYIFGDTPSCSPKCTSQDET